MCLLCIADAAVFSFFSIFSISFFLGGGRESGRGGDDGGGSFSPSSLSLRFDSGMNGLDRN